MGIPTLSPAAGETPARPVQPHETHSVSKKSKKSSKESSPIHFGARSAKGPAEHSPRSFASIYKKSLVPDQSPTSEEDSLPSPEKGKEGGSLHVAKSSNGTERSRKKKARSGGEGAVLLPLVTPGEISEKPEKPSAPSSPKETPVLWGPQKGGASPASLAGKPLEAPSPASPGIIVDGAASIGKEGKMPSEASPEVSPAGGFAGALGAAALAAGTKKAAGPEALRREEPSEKEGARSVEGGKEEVALRSFPSIGKLSSPDIPAPPGGTSSSPLLSGALPDAATKAAPGGEGGTKSTLPDGAEMAAAAETSGAAVSAAETTSGGAGSPSAVVGEIPGQISILAAGGGGQVALEVKPPHLGPVGVRVHVDAATRQVRVELSSHDPHIRHLLAGKEGEIKESLSQSGFVLDRFVVGSQGQPGVGASPDISAGLASPGVGQGSGSDAGTTRQDAPGSGAGAGSGGSLASDPGGFSRQGGNQPGLSGQLGREGGGRSGPEAGESPSGLAEEALSFASPMASGSSPAGYHRIA